MSTNNEVKKLEGEAVNTPQQSPMNAFRDVLIKEKAKLEKVLPAHITFEKFQSTVITACMTNPALLQANRQSLLISCIKAATDGLLPDNRDAALVIFNAKVGKDDSGKDMYGSVVQYMPMYSGILKKVRQSGELAAITVQVVYSKDKFIHRLGDADEIIHEVLDGNDRGEFKAVYAIAKLKDGTVMKDVMYKNDVEKVRKTSKSGAANANDVKYKKAENLGDPKGIWKDWYEEMAKKTQFRRLAKWLPQSIDKEGISRVFDNDDSMDVIDSTIESESYTIEDDKIDEDAPKQLTNQPDLKQEIVKEQEKDKVPVKENAPAEKKKPEDQPAKEQRAQEEKPAEPEKNLLEVEMKIKQLLTDAKDHATGYDVVSEYADDIELIRVKKPAAHKDLNKFIEKRLKELEVKS